MRHITKKLKKQIGERIYSFISYDGEWGYFFHDKHQTLYIEYRFMSNLCEQVVGRGIRYAEIREVSDWVILIDHYCSSMLVAAEEVMEGEFQYE